MIATVLVLMASGAFVAVAAWLLVGAVTDTETSPREGERSDG